MSSAEVADVRAARAALAALPGVDPSDIVVAGHSAGGVLALLASQTAPLFRKVAAFSAWPDLQPVLEMYPEYCVFDCGDPDEIRLRSPRRFERSWTAPLRLYWGRSERELAPWVRRAAREARAVGVDAQAIEVDGDHFSAVSPAIRASIQWFNER